MKGTINDIWNVVDELVDENLDNVLEQDTREAEKSEILRNTEEEFQNDTDDHKEEYVDIPEDIVSWNPTEDNIDYWMQEFENILKDPVPQSKEIHSKGLSPILLGGGGILLLGLITSVAVAIKIKRKTRRFRTLPIVEESVVEEKIWEKEREPKIQREKIIFPFFHFQLPVPLVNKRRGVS